MALPASGTIRQGADVNVELGNSATTQISLGATGVRTLYGVASGAIRLATDGYGKSNAFTATISTNQQQLNLATYAASVGWNGTSAATITIGSGVYIWSDNTAVAGLTTGNFPGGLTIVNNGYIIGKGGAGASSSIGSAGGPALSLGVNTAITNNSGAFIAGGGGGGGSNASGGGGGAGGGAGSASGGSSGAGGAVGSAGAAGGGQGGGGGGSGGGGGGFFPPGSIGPGPVGGGGGGGGRILPGSAGAGGSAYVAGGAGGSANNTGANGSDGSGAGGGGWGANGGASFNGAGGAGGKAIALNGFTATRSGAGTTYGAVS